MSDIVDELRAESERWPRSDISSLFREGIAEIQSLRAERDEARRERDLWKSQVHDEIQANLAFRASGGALPDEDMPTFCGRLIAERDALRARIDGAKVLVATRNGVIRTDTDAFVSGKRVALVPLDD